MEINFKDKFTILFKKVMGIDEITNDLSMNNMRQWDSLKHVELLTEIEEVFDIDIELEDIVSMTNVTGILQILSKYLSSK